LTQPPLASPRFPSPPLFRSDLPAPGSPVNQSVAPPWPSVLQRRSRVTREPCHTMLGLRPPAAESASSSTSVSRITPAATVSLLRSEEHTSELQSRVDLVCRL